jgi:hypothetical protein
MKCDKIRELMLSDHADAELDARRQKTVEDHLKGCSACRLFREDLENAVIAPLKSAGHIEPPPSVWQNIKSRIEEREAFSPAAVFLDRLRGILSYARPALAAVVVSAFLIIGAALATYYLTERNALNAYFAEQTDFMTSLKNGNGNSAEDIGIPAEDFFV